MIFPEKVSLDGLFPVSTARVDPTHDYQFPEYSVGEEPHVNCGDILKCMATLPYLTVYRFRHCENIEDCYNCEAENQFCRDKDAYFWVTEAGSFGFCIGVRLKFLIYLFEFSFD